MRHCKKGKKLGRNKAQRKVLQKQLASDLIMKEKLRTTKTKAKFVKPYVEKIITLSKEKNLATKRRLLVLLNKPAAKKIQKEMAGKFKTPGGYTRTTNLGNRKGDNAPIVQIELIQDQNNAKDISTKK